ncbi:MAG TPA: hypothetical protein VIJ33_10765 [Solirubrobacteraceae bacterium]
MSPFGEDSPRLKRQRACRGLGNTGVMSVAFGPTGSGPLTGDSMADVLASLDGHRLVARALPRGGYEPEDLLLEVRREHQASIDDAARTEGVEVALARFDSECDELAAAELYVLGDGRHEREIADFDRRLAAEGP